MATQNRWKQLRVKLGYRKEELARKAGISSRTIMRLEAGDPGVSPETKSKIKNALAGSVPVRIRF